MKAQEHVIGIPKTNIPDDVFESPSKSSLIVVEPGFFSWSGKINKIIVLENK
jgi:hypothetical protein